MLLEPAVGISAWKQCLGVVNKTFLMEEVAYIFLPLAVSCFSIINLI